MAKLLARLLATAALWVRIQTSLKNTNGRNKQRSGQYTLARQKNIQKKPYHKCIHFSHMQLIAEGLRSAGSIPACIRIQAFSLVSEMVESREIE